MRRITPILLLLTLLIAAFPAGFSATAQGPDAWTTIDLNMRAAPNHATVITILPPNTGLIFEGRDAGMNWLLGHTEDGVYRGWVVTSYLTYAEGFSAARLPISEEVVSPSNPPPPHSTGTDLSAPGHCRRLPLPTERSGFRFFSGRRLVMRQVLRMTPTDEC